MRAYRRAYAILGVLCMATAASGQMTPKAVINAPRETISGDIVTLDASQSQGTAFKWRLCLEPGQPEKSFFGKPSDPQIAFSAGVLKPTTFRFALAAAAANSNGGVDIDIAFHDILIKPLYPPNQTPVPDVPENPTVPVSPNQKVTRVTYVYEKDQSSIPKAVERAISAINADFSGSVVASTFEHDTTNGSDKVPAQYKIAVEAANKAGLPCLVVQAGDVVVKVLGNPKTEAEVREAIK